MKENDIEIKEYMKNVYSKYWFNAREKIYGFSQYDKTLIDLISTKIKGGKLLDVAVGTGYPFASNLRTTNVVYGIDISPKLIDKCKLLYPDIICVVGDAEDLPYNNNFFDLVYSFHSSWYFPNLIKVVSEMLRVTISNGYVIFDIQNIKNKENYKNFKKREKKYKYRLLYYPAHIIKNIVKLAIGKTNVSWQIINHEVPTNPKILESFFLENKINYKVLVRNIDESITYVNENKSYESESRLVFIIKKE